MTLFVYYGIAPNDHKTYVHMCSMPKRKQNTMIKNRPNSASVILLSIKNELSMTQNSVASLINASDSFISFLLRFTQRARHVTHPRRPWKY